MQSLGSIHRS